MRFIIILVIFSYIISGVFAYVLPLPCQSTGVHLFQPPLQLRNHNKLSYRPHIGRSCIKSKSAVFSVPIYARLATQWGQSVALLKSSPTQFVSIPVVAGLVGYITNWVGVKMLFYPIQWLGIPIYRVANQPLGLLGWQGIVPAKRSAMAAKLVEVTISKLLKVSEIFQRLDAQKLSSILLPIINPLVFGGRVPTVLLNRFLKATAKDLILNIESVVDIRLIVIEGLTSDPRILGQFFQNVGRKELRFLVESGFGFGMILGLFQMLVWMLYPQNWTLPVGGAVVGYITNWIALKWIFEPIEPTKVGPFLLQGMFLKRQKEVSSDFSSYIADKVLTSQKVWSQILQEPKLTEFRSILTRNVPLSSSTITKIIEELKVKIGQSSTHNIHGYTKDALGLKKTLIERMNRLSPKEFEQVLHPVFQEDELTLILAGGVLGALAGLLQWWVNVYIERRNKK